MLADNGYCSRENLTAPGPDRLIATGKARDPHAAASDNPAQGPPPEDSDPIAQMRHRLRTPEGIATYRKRSHIAETPFGHAKHNLRFTSRGLARAHSEWNFHTAVHNNRQDHRPPRRSATARLTTAGSINGRPVESAKIHFETARLGQLKESNFAVPREVLTMSRRRDDNGAPKRKRNLMTIVLVILVAAALWSSDSVLAKVPLHFANQATWLSSPGPGADGQKNLADVNADNKADLVVFGHGKDYDGMYVALSTGTGFAAPQKWGSNLCKPGPQQVCLVADVNGDNKSDVLTFAHGDGQSEGSANVWAALSRIY